jgi:BirA family biotin operon repressor/biotin-[acetyl-CoA-carboxylase] ligase
MKHSLVLLQDEVEGVFSPARPEETAAVHSSWARQIEELTAAGQWRRVSLPLASGGELRGLAAAAPTPANIYVCGECGSTMDAARWLSGEGLLEPWDAAAAVRQHSARGQMRRPWSSLAGNLFATVRWPGPPGERFGVGAWDRLTPLVVGWMLAEAFSELGVELEIKWPNDLLWRGRKTAGILVEERGGVTVVGVGLNLANAPKAEALRADSAVQAVSFNEAGLDLPPLALWTRLVTFCQNCYKNLLRTAGPQDFLQKFSRWMAWTGRMATVRESDCAPYQARIIGVAEDGGLRIRRDGAEHIIYSGSVHTEQDDTPRGLAERMS